MFDIQSHFLIGQVLLAVPPRSVLDSDRPLTDRWKLLDQCHQAFWRRWSSEYLTTLQERPIWTKGVPNLRVKDMAIVIYSQSSPLAWRLGRLTEILPGNDDYIRVARVLARLDPIVRLVIKLLPLPTK